MKKIIATLPLVAFLALGSASAVQAAPADAYGVEATDTFHHSDASVHPYHPCHGMTSGTAHASCGTATGGPSGGLF